MKTRITIKIKIPCNQQIINAMKQYSKAIIYIFNMGFKHNVSNRYKLHHITYYKARNKFNLPSQYIINAIRIASQTLKSVKTKRRGNSFINPTYKEFMPLDFDRRTFTFRFDKVRITALNGRIDIPIEIPEYYWKYLDWSYQTMQIIYDRRFNRMFLHISFSKDIVTPTISDRFHGVDVGINNIAVTSNKQFFNSKKIKHTKSKFRYLRSKLQSKGTSSSRKLLKKISGRERRFMRQCNHEISKAIVSSCDIGDTIVMEDIKGIRKIRTNKKTRTWLNNWSFYQLQKFIEYKAGLKGCKVSYINPRNTSKTCSRCLSLKTIRKGFNFHCLNCSYHLNADLNASNNLKSLGKFLTTKVDVNQPYISGDEGKSIIGIEPKPRDNARDFSPE